MNNSTLIKYSDSGEMQFPEGYPPAFAKEVIAQHKRSQQRVKSFVYEKVTVLLNDGCHSRDLFAKVFRNREVLNELSPEACKILIWIGCNIEYKAIRVKLSMAEIGMSRRKYYSAILELMGSFILQKVEAKREWYWVNVAVLVVGNVHDA